MKGIVYIGSYDHRLYALSATTGRILWSYKTGYYIYSSPAIANGIVYVGSDDRSVYALDASTGAMLWSYQTGSYVISSPAVVNGVVYIGSIDHISILFICQEELHKKDNKNRMFLTIWVSQKRKPDETKSRGLAQSPRLFCLSR